MSMLKSRPSRLVGGCSSRHPFSWCNPRPVVAAAITCSTVSRCPKRSPRGALLLLSASAYETSTVAPTSPADEEDTVRLPLKALQLLGLKANEVYKDSEVNEAFDELLATPVEAGYSSLTINGRQDLLEEIRSEVITSKKHADRPAHDVRLPFDLLPGALCLLVQVGQHDLALTLGGELCASEELEAYPLVRNDVLISMALANCGLAAMCFETGMQATAAAGYLEDSLSLLQRGGQAGDQALAPQLAAEIQASLAPLHGQVALEQISQPLAVDAAALAARKRAIRSVRDLIKPADAPHSNHHHPSAAGQAGSSRGSGKASGGGGVGGAGPSGAGGGASPAASHHQPAAAAATTTTGGVDVSLVQQLVGQLTAAELVHLQEWEALARAGPAAAPAWLTPALWETVITAHLVTCFTQRQPAYARLAATLLATQPQQSAEARLLRAVCSVLLGAVDAAMATLLQLKDSAAPSPSVAGWGTAPSSASTSPSRRRQRGDDPDALPATRSAYDFVVEHSPSTGDDGLLPGLCLFTECWLREAAFPLFRDTANVPPPTGLSKYFDDTRVETLLEVYEERAGGAPAGRAASVSAALHGVLASVGAAAAAVASKLPLPLQEALAQRRVAQLLAGAVTLSILAASALAASSLLHPRRTAATSSTAATAVTVPRTGSMSIGRAAAAAQPAAAEVLDTATAEQLVRSWQDAKSASLGPAHSTAALSSVLSEPLLSEARHKAASYKAQGWFMRHKLWKCKVTTVDASAFTKSGAVRVVASLDESASLFGLDGRQADAFRSAYDAEYQVVRQRDGNWRVARVTVLGKEPSAKA